MLSFDGYPIVYWALSYVLASVCVKLSMRPKSTYLFIFLSLLLVVLVRLAIVLFNDELNPDESQIISHALTLRQNPIFWQSVDGTTIGPLDIYLLTFVKVFGGTIDYSIAHAVALGCSVISLLFFFLTIRNLHNESTAKISLLPVAFLLAFTQDADFIHYTSEQVPLILLMGSLWLMSIIYKKNTLRYPIFLLGFTLGMIPFAKLQASIQAIYLGIAMFILLVQRQQIKNVLLLILGGFSFPFLVLIFLISFGLTTSFTEFYINGNLVYADSGNTKNILSQLTDIFLLSPDFLKYLVSIFGLILIGILSIKKDFNRWILSFGIGWILVSVYAITKSGNAFVHYLNLLIYPLALLGAIFVYHSEKPVLKITVAFIPFLVWSISFVPKAFKKQPLNRYVSTSNYALRQSEIAKKILKYARPNDMLVVWGWACRYYVETQLAQGTAENHTERCIYEHPMRQNYRDRFMADMNRNRPAIFVDAVGKNSVWVKDPISQGHQNFVELKAFIDSNYALTDSIDEVKIYVLKTRLTSLEKEKRIATGNWKMKRKLKETDYQWIL